MNSKLTKHVENVLQKYDKDYSRDCVADILKDWWLQ